MSFNLSTAVRQIKPQEQHPPLIRRNRNALTWAAEESKIGGPLMLDTTVYLDVLTGRTPIEVDELLCYRTCHHSSVCLAELTHVFGRLDPLHAGTKTVLAEIQGVIEDDIPAHRLSAPDVEVWAKAGMLAGKVFRLSGLPAKVGHERKILNDTLLFLQARKIGAAVLTRNLRDFDFLQQLHPSGNLVFYDQV